MSAASRCVITIFSSMVVTQAIDVIWFSGALPWQPYVKTHWTPALLNAFLFAVACYQLFDSYTGDGYGQMEDSIRAGVWIAVLHLTFSHSGRDEEPVMLINDGIRCTLIVAATILVISQMRDL